MPIYIKIDGMEGSISAKGYQGCFEAIDLSHSVKRSIIMPAGQPDNRQSGRPAISSFKIMKHVDNTTPLFHSQSAYSQPKSTVTIYLINHPDLQPETVHTLTDVYINSYAVHRTVYNNALQSIEHIELSPVKFETKYTPRDSQGNTQTPIAAGYDLETAQSC